MKLIKKLNMRIEKSGQRLKWALFLCEYCNKKVERRFHNGLKQKSCGCAKGKLISKARITHGDARKGRLYNIWRAMKQRCYNPNNPIYKYYGGRGIIVCRQWERSYIVFKIWAENNGYKNNLQIGREENNGNYEPSNCRFVTSKINVRNSRTTKLTMKKANQIRSLYFNKKITQNLLAKKFGVPQSQISCIISNKSWV